MRPESFDADLSMKWSDRVLAHGLPELPGRDLDVGQSVPVAYWIGPSTAAVLHIRRMLWEGDDEAVTETNTDLYCLVDTGWETQGAGGGAWEEDSPLSRIEVPPSHVRRYGPESARQGERGCKALVCEVGTDAAFAEVIQTGQVTRRRIEAPIGLLVVSAEYAHPFTLRVLNAGGELLAAIEEPSGFSDELDVP